MRALLIVLAVSTALTMASAWPVLIHPTQRVFGTEIVGRHADAYTVIRQFAGQPVPTMYLQPATDWTGRLLASVMPPVAAYNVVVLMTFPLAACFAFLFAYEVTRSSLAASIAGLAFAFAPFHFAHAAYHPHISQVQWIALFAWALWRSVHGFTFPRAMVLVITAAVAVLANDYHALVIAGVTPFAAVGFWLVTVGPSQSRKLRDLVGAVLSLAVPAAAALLAIHYWLPQAFSSNFATPREELSYYSAQWWSYLVPPVDHPVFKRLALDAWATYGTDLAVIEQQVYVGWSLLILATVGVIGFWRHRRGVTAGFVLLALAAVTLICSLPPVWRIGHVTFNYPPSALLHSLLPMFRSYARFAVVVQLCLSVLAGAGACVLWKRRTTRLVALVLLSALVFEYSPVHARSRDVLPTEGHRWLAEHGGGTRVFDCSPFRLSDFQTAWLAGYDIGYFGPTVPDCGEPGLASKLRAQGYGYLLVRGRRQERPPIPASRADGFVEAHTSFSAVVYRLEAEMAQVYVSEMTGVYGREYGGGLTWRWAGQQANLRVVNADSAIRTAALDIDLAAYARLRHIAVTLDGVAVARLEVPTSRTTFRLGPFHLAPGTHDLAVESVEPAETPSASGGTPDTRRLALVVLGWRWNVR